MSEPDPVVNSSVCEDCGAPAGPWAICDKCDAKHRATCCADKVRLRVWYRLTESGVHGRKGSWAEIPEGPFRITRYQLDVIRKRVAEQRPSQQFLGRDMAPHTLAREALREVGTLKDFDRLVLSAAVLAKEIRTEEV